MLYYIYEEIKSRLNFGNVCCYSFRLLCFPICCPKLKNLKCWKLASHMMERLRKWCWGEYLDVRGRNGRLMVLFIRTSYQILLGWWNTILTQILGCCLWFCICIAYSVCNMSVLHCVGRIVKVNWMWKIWSGRVKYIHIRSNWKSCSSEESWKKSEGSKENWRNLSWHQNKRKPLGSSWRRKVQYVQDWVR